MIGNFNCHTVTVSQLLFVVEIVEDNLCFGGADEGTERFEICLTYLLNRFKAI